MIPAPVNTSDLLPGDCLIFTGGSVFDHIEEIKLGSAAVHAEIYIGDGQVLTSKFGTGVQIYGVNLDGLHRVLRPIQNFDRDAALANFKRTVEGLPYGYEGLLEFADVNYPSIGLFCSQTCTLVYRSVGIDPFNDKIPARKVAPMHFLYIHESVFRIEFQA